MRHGRRIDALEPDQHLAQTIFIQEMAVIRRPPGDGRGEIDDGPVAVAACTDDGIGQQLRSGADPRDAFVLAGQVAHQHGQAGIRFKKPAAQVFFPALLVQARLVRVPELGGEPLVVPGLRVEGAHQRMHGRGNAQAFDSFGHFLQQFQRFFGHGVRTGDGHQPLGTDGFPELHEDFHASLDARPMIAAGHCFFHFAQQHSSFLFTQCA